MDTLLAMLSAYWEVFLSWVTSLDKDYFTAAIGSFFGAVGGYVMVWLTNRRSEVFAKVGNIKKAISLTHSIFNTFLGLKKQHVKSLCENYERNRAAFIEIRQRQTLIPAGAGPIEVVFQMDFRTLFFPHTDLELINTCLIEKADLDHRAFALANALISSIHNLKNQFDARHAIIRELNQIRQAHNLSEHDALCLYFGQTLEHPQLGIVTFEYYSGATIGIKDATDDVIWFSKELALELIQVAKATAKKLIFSRPKIGSVDYSDVETDLLPNDANYRDWREKFKKPDGSVKKIWKSILRTIVPEWLFGKSRRSK